jgi:pantetheine-phosphate adenylyltransferase
VRIAVYPASFDPIHLGHVDIARRAARIVDRLIVCVYDRPNKKLMFTAEERVEMARVALADITNIEVMVYSGLTVDFAREHGATIMVRGLRMPTDFEWEHQLAQTNQKLAPGIETVCLMTSPQYGFISSTIVRDITTNGGPLEALVPAVVIPQLRHRAAELNGATQTVIPASQRVT